jgi:hypothetical protein
MQCYLFPNTSEAPVMSTFFKMSFSFIILSQIKSGMTFDSNKKLNTNLKYDPMRGEHSTYFAIW